MRPFIFVFFTMRIRAFIPLFMMVAIIWASFSCSQKPRMNTVETFVEEQKKSGKKSNRLIKEKSPYLLQHAFNPVDWYSWGEEAFERARKEDKPIFLSIGYSTCYWCHVMEREVFENPAIARMMNEFFVNIKVDREERPDVDRVYMAAVQAISGSGGWPMSVFLTPDLEPFFGATYIPPDTRDGRMGFPELANRIHDLWQTQRKKIVESGNELTAFLKRRSVSEPETAVGEEVLRTGYVQFLQQYDSVYGGFGNAPKFPRPVTFNFLLRYFARTGEHSAVEMSLTTLRKMAEGGMYDHLGGGFHRYSVDALWRVPHFEKMLYDQAQLVNSYLDAYQITHDEFYARIAREVLEYVLQKMTDQSGGFYSAEDAESALDPAKPRDKAEGEFYLWRKKEIEEILGREESEIVKFYFGVEEEGNTLHDPHGVFGNKNVLYIAHSFEETGERFGETVDEIKRIIEQGKENLFEVREQRPRSHLDDKIITSWNGLMISAFARAFQVLGDAAYLAAAEKAARFINTSLYDESKQQLLRRFRDGEARFEAHLEDYAFLVAGFLDLYEASFDVQWLERAVALTEKQVRAFYDEERGGFWDTSGKDASILIRTKEDYDGAEPSGNAVATLNLLRLAQIIDNRKWKGMAEKTLAFFSGQLKQTPQAMPQMLVAVDFNLTKPKQIIIAGKNNNADTIELLREMHGRYVPNKVLLLADGDKGQRVLASYNQFFESIVMREGKATAYVCEDYVCKLPVTDARAFAEQLR
jgi:uncharacterized protein YyaL (SSP411 family)